MVLEYFLHYLCSLHLQNFYSIVAFEDALYVLKLQEIPQCIMFGIAFLVFS
jgi:hypothetical protein